MRNRKTEREEWRRKKRTISDGEIPGIFGDKDEPDIVSGWALYEDALVFNNAINLNETVRVNENFYVGKQWEGVESNGLPTPVFNFLKRVVGFIVATITTDNIRVNATPMAATANTEELVEPARIVNEEFERLAEQNKIPSLMRQFARNAAVDGDGCLYTYWDPDEKTGEDGVKGAIKTEIVENTRVFFGNPQDRRVQTQPWIIISSREFCRDAQTRAKENGMEDYASIAPDDDDRDIDSVKTVGDDEKCTVLLLMWKNEKTDTVWCYEFTRNCGVKAPWDTEMTLYPINWLNWDYVQNCYHGQSMITGLIPNQIFVNKIWAASMLSFLKTAYPKVIYDKTRVSKWDNRVGGAIGINGGDVNTVARIMDPATISPQIAQFIELAVNQTEESLGATAVALGDTRPDNTSAIIALQRAAATPTELTKQNLYQCMEDLFRIYLEFMATFYKTRKVDTPTPEKVQQAAAFAGVEIPDEVPMEFDFSELKNHPMLLKLDVGASSYYSEIASMNTLDNLLQQKQITLLQYMERIPDGYIPARRALINELKQQAAQQQMMMQQQMGQQGAPTAPEAPILNQEKPEIPNTGGGFGALQRKIVEQGNTEGMV